MMRLLDRMRLRLRSLLHGAEMDDALRNEVRVHIEEHTAELVAGGMSPSKARSGAARIRADGSSGGTVPRHPTRRVRGAPGPGSPLLVPVVVGTADAGRGVAAVDCWSRSARTRRSSASRRR
jgi:hypothetical protein